MTTLSYRDRFQAYLTSDLYFRNARLIFYVAASAWAITMAMIAAAVLSGFYAAQIYPAGGTQGFFLDTATWAAWASIAFWAVMWAANRFLGPIYLTRRDVQRLRFARI